MTLVVCALAVPDGVHLRAENANDETATAPLRLATFLADVTPPLGHPLFGSISPPAQEIGEPLSARGLVLLGCGDPIVIVAVDWLEIRNDAYRSWREALAEAAGTRPERVLVSCVHQHDAPLADLTAQRLLADRQVGRAMDRSGVSSAGSAQTWPTHCEPRCRKRSLSLTWEWAKRSCKAWPRTAATWGPTANRDTIAAAPPPIR